MRLKCLENFSVLFAEAKRKRVKRERKTITQNTNFDNGGEGGIRTLGRDFLPTLA